MGTSNLFILRFNCIVDPDGSGHSGFEVYPDMVGALFALHPDAIGTHDNRGAHLHKHIKNKYFDQRKPRLSNCLDI